MCFEAIDATLLAGAAKGSTLAITDFDTVIVSDLMSDVLVVEEERFILCTSLASEQVIRTADIVGAVAVVLCNGKNAPTGMKQLADANGVPLLSTPLRTFEVCRRIIRCREREETGGR